MDTISKTSRMYAADMVPGVRQYEHSTPSQILADCIRAEVGEITAESLAARLPGQMVGVTFSKRGGATVGVVRPADFLGQGTAGSGIAGSGIVPILAADVCIEGAKPYMAVRSAVQTVSMGSEMMTVPFFSPQKPAKKRAANADTDELEQTIGKAVLAARNYGVVARIPKEIIADANADVVTAVLREMGGAVEQAMNRDVVAKMIAEAGQTQTATLGQELKDFNLAKALVDAKGFRATSSIVSPLFLANMVNTYIPAYNDAAQSAAVTGELPTFVGISIGEDGSDVDGYGWTAATNVGAVVFDRGKAGILGIRQDIAADQDDDLLKNLADYAVRMRADYAVCNAAAMAKIVRPRG